MRAILLEQPGDPDQLRLHEVADPASATGTQLRVRLHAAGINPLDTKLRARGTYYPEQMPAILGCDGAGVIESVGPDVTQYQIGDRVMFFNGGIGGHGVDQGNYAEYTLVDAAYVAHIPDNIDFAHAAAAPLACITAWESLFDRVQLKSTDTVLIHAGAGGVGHIAIQLARNIGARVITTIGDESRRAFVESLDADLVINYRAQDFVQEVLSWTEGKGADVCFDTVGGKTLEQSFAATKVYGDIVTLLQPDVETDWKIARIRNLRMTQELMLTPMVLGLSDARHHQGEILRRCAALMATGALEIEVAATYPLEQAADAHRQIEAGGMQGKLIFEIR
jgi:NADPH2:quinone reductase